MSEPFDSKYKLFKEIGIPHSGMSKNITDTLEHDGSHLTIRDDLVADELGVPVHFLDYKEDVHILSTNSTWFGVTYKEDKPLVIMQIQNLIKSGIYPDKLF